MAWISRLASLKLNQLVVSNVEDGSLSLATESDSSHVGVSFDAFKVRAGKLLLLEAVIGYRIEEH